MSGDQQRQQNDIERLTGFNRDVEAAHGEGRGARHEYLENNYSVESQTQSQLQSVEESLYIEETQNHIARIKELVDTEADQENAEQKFLDYFSEDHEHAPVGFDYNTVYDIARTDRYGTIENISNLSLDDIEDNYGEHLASQLAANLTNAFLFNSGFDEILQSVVNDSSLNIEQKTQALQGIVLGNHSLSQLAANYGIENRLDEKEKLLFSFFSSNNTLVASLLDGVGSHLATELFSTSRLQEAILYRQTHGTGRKGLFSVLRNEFEGMQSDIASGDRPAVLARGLKRSFVGGVVGLGIWGGVKLFKRLKRKVSFTEEDGTVKDHENYEEEQNKSRKRKIRRIVTILAIGGGLGLLLTKTTIGKELWNILTRLFGSIGTGISGLLTTLGLDRTVERVTDMVENARDRVTETVDDARQALGLDVVDPDESVEVLNENIEVREKANAIGDRVNHFWQPLSGSFDRLGEAEYEQGYSGAIVHSLSSFGNAQELLSYDIVHRLGYYGPIDKLISVLETWPQAMADKFVSSLTYFMEEDSWLYSNIKKVVLGEGESIERKEETLAVIADICRKYHKTLVWLEHSQKHAIFAITKSHLESDITPLSIEQQSYQQLDDATQKQQYIHDVIANEEFYESKIYPIFEEKFLGRTIISEEGPDLYEFFTEHEALDFETDPVLVNLVEDNNKKKNTNIASITEMINNPENLNECELSNICDYLIGHVEDFGERTWLSQILSGISVYVQTESLDKERILEKSGWYDLSAMYTVTARDIKEKIDAGEDICPEDLADLKEAHEKYTGLINELTIFSHVRTEIIDNDEGIHMLGYIPVSNRRLSPAGIRRGIEKGYEGLKIWGNDVLERGEDFLGGFHMMQSGNYFEGAAQVGGSYIALRWLTFPRRLIYGRLGLTGRVLRIADKYTSPFYRSYRLVKPIIGRQVHYAQHRVKVSIFEMSPVRRRYILRGPERLVRGNEFYQSPEGLKAFQYNAYRRWNIQEAAKYARLAKLKDSTGNLITTADEFVRSLGSFDDVAVQYIIQYWDHPVGKQLLTMTGKYEKASFSFVQESLTRIQNIEGSLYRAVSTQANINFCQKLLQQGMDFDLLDDLITNIRELNIGDILAKTGMTLDDFVFQFIKNIKNFDSIDDILLFLHNVANYDFDGVTHIARFVIQAMKQWKGIKGQTNPLSRVVQSRGLGSGVSGGPAELLPDNLAVNPENLPTAQSQLADAAEALDDMKAASTNPEAIAASQKAVRNIANSPADEILPKIKVMLASGKTYLVYAARFGLQALGAVGALYGGYEAISTFMLATETEEINQKKAELLRQKGVTESMLAVGGALLLIPGLNMLALVGGAIITLGYLRKETYYGIMNRYLTNYYELKQQMKFEIYHHLMAMAGGRTEVDKSWKESFTEGLTHKDMDFLGANGVNASVRALLFVDALEDNENQGGLAMLYTLSEEKLDNLFKQLHTEHPEQFPNYETFYGNIYRQFGQVKDEVERRYTQLTNTLGTYTTQESVTTYIYIPTTTGSLVPVPSGSVKGQEVKVVNILKHDGFLDALENDTAIQRIKEQLLSTDDYDSLASPENISEAHVADESFVENFVPKTAEWMAGHKEKLNNSQYPLINILYRIAKEVHQIDVNNDIESLRMVYNESYAGKLGIYFDSDTVIKINNDNEYDMGFGINSGPTYVQKFREEMQEAIDEEDLFFVQGDSGEALLNREYGRQYLAIVDEEMERMGMTKEGYLEAMISEVQSHQGSLIQLPLEMIQDGINVGFTHVGEALYRWDDEEHDVIVYQNGSEKTLRSIVEPMGINYDSFEILRPGVGVPSA